jgi:CubicO group peptidase (beta-lactamase class C family)
MTSMGEAIDDAADRIGFSGVVRIDEEDGSTRAAAYGDADRAHGIANTTDTVFGLASGGKGFTALAVASLIEDGTLTLDTTARSILGDDLPLIADDVTVELLLAHRSGIGDYLDEEEWEVTDVVMPVSVHKLVEMEDFVGILDGFPMAFPPGERFAYNNGAFVVLAVLAERAAGTPYRELVRARVCEPAGLTDTGFLRSDELPGRAALGYLGEGPRTNIFHLPVFGSPDGGIYSTAADVRSMWMALFDGRIVRPETVAEMVRPRSDVPEDERRYGLGFWLHETSDVVMLVGYDAGASFRTAHDPTSSRTRTVISNQTAQAWDMTDALDEVLGPM